MFYLVTKFRHYRAQVSLAIWPLWARIAIALCCAMLLVAYGAIRIGQEYRAQEIGNQLEAQSSRTLGMFSVGALEPVISEDIAILKTLISETVNLEHDIHSISVTNASGQELAAWKKDNRSYLDNSVVFERSVDFEGENFGTITTVWDPARITQAVDTKIAKDRIYLIGSLFCLTVLSLVLLHVLVTSPLSKIDGRLRLLSESDSDTHNLPPLTYSSSKEISRLASATNELKEAINASKHLAIELEYQANHDYLTGLDNRSSFERVLSERLSNRNEASPEETLLYFDLDQFKVVNDTCGHAAGDALLKQLSTIVKKQVRPFDTVARLGGDEFAILLHETSLNKGIKVAEQIRSEIADFRFSWDNRSFNTEASIGAVGITSPDVLFNELLAKADMTCYEAKSAGRNRVQVFQEDDTVLSERQSQMTWIPRINDAVENSKLVLFGQAIEEAKPGIHSLLHIEMLVRMRDDDNNLIPPGAFLPAAERYGLISQIDRWVVSNTLEWMSEQQHQSGLTNICAINISGASICDDQFRKFLLSALNVTDVPGENICFEITETAAVSNLSAAVDFMLNLKEFGCCFALDDFGTGMSSFTYLKNLPVDFVKIDGAFVRDLLNDETSLAMVRAMADIAHVMNIRSIAEFVETDDIRCELENIGIDFVQGYGVGKPKPLDDFCTQQQRKAA